MLKYDLHSSYSSSEQGQREAQVFNRIQNAANDAIAPLKSSLFIITDSIFGTDSYNYDDTGDHDYMDNFVNTSLVNVDANLQYFLPLFSGNTAEGKAGKASKFGFT